MSGDNALAWSKIVVFSILGLLLGVLLYYAYGFLQRFLKAAGDAAKKASDFITGGDDPATHNVASRAVDKTLQTAGVISKDDSLGTAIYNVFHPDIGSAADQSTQDQATANGLPIGVSVMTVQGINGPVQVVTPLII